MASAKKAVTKSGAEDVTVYRFYCPSKIWKALKQATPKSMTMNDKLLSLVYKDLGIENPNTGSVKLTTKK